jgi:hypothetical protein
MCLSQDFTPPPPIGDMHTALYFLPGRLTISLSEFVEEKRLNPLMVSERLAHMITSTGVRQTAEGPGCGNRGPLENNAAG